MSKSKPKLREAFDKVERAVGEPLEELVSSKTYTDTMVKAKKVHTTIQGTVADLAAGAAEKVLHIAQIPTRSDVRNLNRQIAELATEIRMLSAKLQEVRTSVAKSKTRARKTTSKSAAAKKRSKTKRGKAGGGN